MAWSITEVARMSKVTSRTLRHYDDVGLLRPAYVGSNGYRYYEQEQLLRLQQVLLLRELGLGLGAIAEVLAGDRDRVTALRQHERWLHSERRRLGQLADTVSRTIRQLQGEDHMTGPELFEGFADRQGQLEEDLVTEHGEGVREHFRSAREVTKDWTQQDYFDAQRRGELDDKVLEVMRSGAAPGSRAALGVMAEHYQGVAQFWTPDRESYSGLGRMYVDNAEFKARYDAKAPGLAEYLRDATAAYAEQGTELTRPCPKERTRATPGPGADPRLVELTAVFGCDGNTARIVHRRCRACGHRVSGIARVLPGLRPRPHTEVVGGDPGPAWSISGVRRQLGNRLAESLGVV